MTRRPSGRIEPISITSSYGHTSPQRCEYDRHLNNALRKEADAADLSSITGGKNCFIPMAKRKRQAAGTSNSMMITGGGINQILAAGKGPKVWWQFTTAAEFRTKNQWPTSQRDSRIRAALASRSRSTSIMSPAASAASTTGWCATGASKPKGSPE